MLYGVVLCDVTHCCVTLRAATFHAAVRDFIALCCVALRRFMLLRCSALCCVVVRCIP